MKLYQRLTLVMLVIAACVLLGSALVFHNQDMAHYRDRIQQLMLDRTGRDLQIRGDIRAMLFPSVGLSLRDVWIANAAGFEADSFAQIEHARLRVDLLPLLGGDVVINRLEMRGASLNLQRDPEGRSNWADLMEQTSLVEARSDEDILQEIEAAAPVAGLLSVGELYVVGGQVNWVDQQKDQHAELQNLSVKSGRIALLEPFDLAVEFDATPDDGAFSTSVSAKGLVDFDLQQNRLFLDLARLQTTTNLADRPTSHVGASLSGQMVADIAAQTLEMRALEGELADIPLSGELYITQMLSEPALFGELQAVGIDGANLLVDLGVRLPAGFDGNLLRKANIDARLQYSAGELALSEVVFESGGITLHGDLLAANLLSSPVYSGTLRSERFDARPWVAVLGLQLPGDQELFENVQFQSQIRQSGQLLALNKLQLQLDAMQVSGDIEIADIQSTVRPLNFELQINELDIDRYRQINLLEDDEPAWPASDALAELIDALPSFDVQGQMNFDLLRIAGIELSNVKLPVVIGKDRIEVKEAIGTLYSGSVFASVGLDSSLDPPRGSATINLNGFELGPLLRDHHRDDNPLLSGTGNINIDLHGRGARLEEMIDGTSGALSLKFTNGSLYFVSVIDELRRARSELIGRSELDDLTNQTTYTELNLSAVFEDRQLLSEDLSLTTPLMRITGLGEVDFSDAQLDLALTGTLTTSTGLGNDDLVILNGLQLPLRLRGDVAALRDNFSGLSKSELRASLGDALMQRREEIIQQDRESQARREALRESELESGMQRERDSVESKMVNEVPTASSSNRAAIGEDEFRRALEDGKARFGNDLSEETRRELSNLIDD